MEFEVSEDEIELAAEFEQDLADLILASQAALAYFEAVIGVGSGAAKKAANLGITEILGSLRYALEPFQVAMNDKAKDRMN